jgi:hypothetical protein
MVTSYPGQQRPMSRMITYFYGEHVEEFIDTNSSALLINQPAVDPQLPIKI